ncbi:MAG: BrnT family toxin [Tepidisphaeraceae bacterium]
MNELRFVWGDNKATSNRRKHGVGFEEAQTIFNDPHLMLRPDIDHSVVEDRMQAIGMSDKSRILFVVYVELHEDFIRIISARKASRQEREEYEGGLAQEH